MNRPGTGCIPHGWLRLAGLILALSAAAPGMGGAQEVDAADAVVTLEEAIRMALEHAPATVASGATLRTARADLWQARGALLPSVSVNSFYSNSSNERFDQTSGRLVSENYTAQLQATYDIFTGGRRLAQLRAAGAGVDAAAASHRERRFATVLQATETFYAAAAATDLVEVAAQRLARARRQAEFAEQRFDVGTATMSDVLRAQIEMGTAELAAFEAQAALRSASLELGRTVGVGGEVRPADTGLPEKAPALPSLEALIERGLRGSPGVLAADAVRSSRRADRLAAYTPYLPSLRISGGYDWFAYEFPPRQQSWSFRLFASLPVFNGLQREAAVARAAAQEDVAEARARDARIALRVAVEGAVQDMGLAERRVEVSRRTVGLAQEDLRVQEERYQIGAATILELQASQVALAEAEVAEVRARQMLGGAVARLEAVLGESLGGEE